MAFWLVFYLGNGNSFILERGIVYSGGETSVYTAVSLFLHIGGAVFLLSKTKSGFLYLYQKFRILVISTGTTILFVVFCDPGFAVKVDHSCSSVGRAWVL